MCPVERWLLYTFRIKEINMKIVIIDDEQNCRFVLRDKILKLDSSYEIIGEAAGVESGIELIHQKKPEMVFLDIQMNDGTGFDLLNKIEFKNFHLIFTTAFDQYAIKAFKYAAIDYLLKPVDFNELSVAMKRVSNLTNTRDLTEGFLTAYDNGAFDTICLRTEDNIHEVELTDIESIKAEGSYCVFYLRNKNRIMISKPLKEYVELLPIPAFMRTHKSFLINLDLVESYKYKSSKLVLHSGEEIPVSRRNKQNVLNYVVKNKKIKLLKNS